MINQIKNCNSINNYDSVSLWEKNARLWIELTENGYDLLRDKVGTPSFFAKMPMIESLYGLDIGCGDGYHTRLLASKSAKVVGIDLCENFISYAKEKEENEQLGIKYQIANALDLPFKNETFDFATSFFSLVDIFDYGKAIQEAYRVLKSNGFFQILIPHPCFWSPDNKWIYNESSDSYSVVSNSYGSSAPKINEWTFEKLDFEEMKKQNKLFKTYNFQRSISEFVNAFIKHGFKIENLEEPVYSGTKKDVESECLKYSRTFPLFLIILARKV